MSRNGKQQPARPRIELKQTTASPEEAAAIAAAIEQFLRDTTPPPAPTGPRTDPWLRAGLFEATGRGAEESTPWGDTNAWGSR
jgi:hypothetical protein